MSTRSKKRGDKEKDDPKKDAGNEPEKQVFAMFFCMYMSTCFVCMLLYLLYEDL
jgi:hypothetical protein